MYWGRTQRGNSQLQPRSLGFDLELRIVVHPLPLPLVPEFPVCRSLMAVVGGGIRIRGAEDWESESRSGRILLKCQPDTYYPSISRDRVSSRCSQQHARRSVHADYNVTRHCRGVDCHGSNPSERDGDAVWRLLRSPHHPTRPRRQSCLRGKSIFEHRFNTWGRQSDLRASDLCGSALAQTFIHNQIIIFDFKNIKICHSFRKVLPYHPNPTFTIHTLFYNDRFKSTSQILRLIEL